MSVTFRQKCEIGIAALTLGDSLRRENALAAARIEVRRVHFKKKNDPRLQYLAARD